MKREKQQKLTKAGWRVGSAVEFLGLTAAETAFVELKLSLAHSLRHHRTARALTQADVAKALGSSQSRVAKMEAGDSSVSLDLLVRSLLALGATPSALASAIARPANLHEEPAHYDATKPPQRKKRYPAP